MWEVINDKDFKEIKIYNSKEEYLESYSNDIKEFEEKYGNSLIPIKIKFIIPI